jgi:hypothetical protein
MNSYRNGEHLPDIDRILADVFAEDAPPSEPPLLIPALLARTVLTRQRPAWRIPARWLPASVAWRPRTHGRLDVMATPIKIAAAAAVIGVLAVVGGIVPRTPGPGVNDLMASPSPSPIALPNPVAGVDGATVELVAGTTYLLDDLWDVGSADLIFTVPATGWLHAGYGNLAKHPIDNGLGMWELLITPWWTIRNLSADPCRWQSEGELAPPVGPTVDDLATALVTQAAGNASGPTDVAVGGYRGKRLELSLPTGLDIATCDGGEFVRWWDEPGVERGGWMYVDGRNIEYILDVGGTRAVIDTLYKSGTSEADLAEAEQLITSMRFEFPAPVPSQAPSPSTAR